MPYESARNGIEHRLLSNAVYSLVRALSLSRSTLSRWMYGLRSRHAPEEQNLPTMSVEYDRPTSGPLPPAMAWVTLESSWPLCTFTLIFGWSFWKSLTTPSMASASRSVKKCQNVTSPVASVPALAISSLLAPGVQAVDRSAAMVPAASAVNARRAVCGRANPRRRPVISEFPLGSDGW